MEPPPRSLALDAHYCIMVRVPWPTEYKYASAIGCACWRAPLGSDSLPTTTCYSRPNAEPIASAFPRSRRGHGRPSDKQREKTTPTSTLTEITPYKSAGDSATTRWRQDVQTHRPWRRLGRSARTPAAREGPSRGTRRQVGSDRGDP